MALAATAAARTNTGCAVKYCGQRGNKTANHFHNRTLNIGLSLFFIVGCNNKLIAAMTMSAALPLVLNDVWQMEFAGYDSITFTHIDDVCDARDLAGLLAQYNIVGDVFQDDYAVHSSGRHDSIYMAYTTEPTTRPPNFPALRILLDQLKLPEAPIAPITDLANVLMHVPRGRVFFYRGSGSDRRHLLPLPKSEIIKHWHLFFRSHAPYVALALHVKQQSKQDASELLLLKFNRLYRDKQLRETIITDWNHERLNGTASQCDRAEVTVIGAFIYHLQRVLVTWDKFNCHELIHFVI